MLGLAELGAIGIILLGLFIILLPLVLVYIVGSAFASYFGFTGLTWWAFMILFYFVISGVFTMIGR